MKKVIRQAIGVVLRCCLAVVILVCFLIGCADRFIFQPPPQRSEPGPDMHLVEVAPEVRIGVLLLLAESAQAPVLLYCHGNATDLFELEEYLAEYPAHGFSVAALDYEGYGASSGKPSEGNCYRDAEALYRWLTEYLKIPAQQIYIYGHSVGSGPACYLAEKYPAAGLILEAPFLSAFRVVAPLPLPFDRFPNRRRIGNIRMPVLIMHGLQDEVIASEHGRKLWELANEPKEWWAIPDAGHNDILWLTGTAYWERLRNFTAERL